MLPASPDEVPTGPFQSVRDLRVSNLRDTSVTLSWTTDEPTAGYVLYGETKELGQVAVDGRGAQLSAETHYVTLTKLKPETRYYFKVVSGAEDDTNTSFPSAADSIITASTLEKLPESDSVYGQVFLSDGVTPATGALLYLTLKEAGRTGDTGEATLLSALVDSEGYWHANLNDARTADLERTFSYSASGDELLIEVQDADGGTASQTVDTANHQQAPDIIIKASSPTGISVATYNTDRAKNNWALLVLTLLLAVAGWCFRKK